MSYPRSGGIRGRATAAAPPTPHILRARRRGAQQKRRRHVFRRASARPACCSSIAGCSSLLPVGRWGSLRCGRRRVKVRGVCACAWVRACVSFCVLPRPNSTWPPTRINPPAQVDRVRAAHPWPLAGLPSSLLRWESEACGQRGGRRQGRSVGERAAGSSSSRPLGCCNGGSTDETTLADDDDRGAGGRLRRSFGRRVGLAPWVVLAAVFSPPAPHTHMTTRRVRPPQQADERARALGHR